MSLVEQRPDTKTRRGSHSRTKILESAMALLREGGIGALSISALSARAGVAPTSIYHHFGSKAGLITALTEHSRALNVAWFRARLAGQTTNEGLLEAYLSGVREMIVSNAAPLSLILGALGQAKSLSPEIAAVLVEARRETWRMIGEEFAAIVGIEDGTRFAHAAVAFEAYAVQVYQESKDPADIDALLASLRHVLTLIGKDELGADDPSQPHVSRQEPQSKTPSGGSK